MRRFSPVPGQLVGGVGARIGAIAAKRQANGSGLGRRAGWRGRGGASSGGEIVETRESRTRESRVSVMQS